MHGHWLRIAYQWVYHLLKSLPRLSATRFYDTDLHIFGKVNCFYKHNKSVQGVVSHCSGTKGWFSNYLELSNTLGMMFMFSNILEISSKNNRYLTPKWWIHPVSQKIQKFVYHLVLFTPQWKGSKTIWNCCDSTISIITMSYDISSNESVICFILLLKVRVGDLFL